jgi:hypothetical protein
MATYGIDCLCAYAALAVMYACDCLGHLWQWPSLAALPLLAMALTGNRATFASGPLAAMPLLAMAFTGSYANSGNDLHVQPCHFWQWPSLAAMPLLAMAFTGSHATSGNGLHWQPCHLWQMAFAGSHATSSGHICL